MNDNWVTCSPEWLAAGGDCATAPRYWSEADGNHKHPAIPSEQTVATAMRAYTSAASNDMRDMMRAALMSVAEAPTPSNPAEVGAREPIEFATIPKAALDWLMGAGPDPAGLWFGDFPEDHPRPPGAFWWRTTFRDIIAFYAAAPSLGDTQDGVGDDDGEAQILAEQAAENMRLIDWIADRIGLPHDEELSRSNFDAYLTTPVASHEHPLPDIQPGLASSGEREADRDSIRFARQFADMYRSGAQGASMEYDAAQALALAIDDILQALKATPQ